MLQELAHAMTALCDVAIVYEGQADTELCVSLALAMVSLLAAHALLKCVTSNDLE